MNWWDKWKIFVSKIKDEHPADGLKPMDSKVYDIHPGGPSAEDFPPLTMDDYLNAPLEKLQKYARPPKDRPALQIDKPKGAPAFFSQGRLERDEQDPDYKSDSPLQLPASVDEIREKWNVQYRELTWLEASNTITRYEADRERERMEEWNEALGNAETLDVELYHIDKELNDMENSIRALKTRNNGGEQV